MFYFYWCTNSCYDICILTCVPSVALGYSIKSVGIATDLSMPVDTVVDSKQYHPGALEKAYNYVEENVTEIRRELEMIIPEYKKKCL